jgi:hypothetical protein
LLLDEAMHRELCADYEARTRAGTPPEAAWRDATAALRHTPTSMFPALLAIEARRLALGLSGDLISERAGIADRCYHKLLRPWRQWSKRWRSGLQLKAPGSGGRIPSWPQIEWLAGAVGLDLAKVPPRAMTRGEFERRLANLAVRHGLKDYRIRRMRELAALGGAAYRAKVPAETRRRVASNAATVCAMRMTPDQRTARARAAAIARWAAVASKHGQGGCTPGGVCVGEPLDGCQT